MPLYPPVSPSQITARSANGLRSISLLADDHPRLVASGAPALVNELGVVDNLFLGPAGNFNTRLVRVADGVIGTNGARVEAANVPRQYGTTATSAATSATPVNIAGLAHALLANTTYYVEAWVPFTSSATGIGGRVAFTGPASPTALFVSVEAQSSATVFTAGQATAYGTAVGGAAVDAANAVRSMKVRAAVVSVSETPCS